MVRDEDDSARSEPMPDRSTFNPMDTVKHIWTGLDLPEHALQQVHLEGSGTGLPSSFKVGHLAQASVALSALAASLVDSVRNQSATVREVAVPLRHAMAEFCSERLYALDAEPVKSVWGPIGGLHETKDGFVRIHDALPNHRDAALRILKCDLGNATRADVSSATKRWHASELEENAIKDKAVIYRLRSYSEWDELPQARAVPDFPISIRKISRQGPTSLSAHIPSEADRCLRGLRVLEFSRVIAAPVAGKTLAAHGADVLWFTSPNLPDLPALDCDFSRGKRTVQLDLGKEDDKATFRRLVKDADVFLQSYRPGSLSNKGCSIEELARIRPGIIVANLNAWGQRGPWSGNRGFDSIVQTVSGMNVSEAEHYGDGSPARELPCQALDHAAGYLLATGIAAAVYKRAIEGGSWEVHVSLAAVMKYLRSLGQFSSGSGFASENLLESHKLDDFFETRKSELGLLKAVRHSAMVEGKNPGFDCMPKRLGSDKPEWLNNLIKE